MKLKPRNWKALCAARAKTLMSQTEFHRVLGIHLLCILILTTSKANHDKLHHNKCDWFLFQYVHRVPIQQNLANVS